MIGHQAAQIHIRETFCTLASVSVSLSSPCVCVRLKNKRRFKTRDEMKERTEEESRSKTQGGAFGEVAGESGTKAFGSSQEMCLVILGQAKKKG